MSDSPRSHELQHARPPYPLPTAGVYPNPCPLSQWCHPTISASVVPFSSCPQSFPASGSSQMSQLFASDGQSIEVSASTSVPPMNTQDWSHLGWTGWISLQSKGLSRVFSSTTVKALVMINLCEFCIRILCLFLAKFPCLKIIKNENKNYVNRCSDNKLEGNWDTMDWNLSHFFFIPT